MHTPILRSDTGRLILLHLWVRKVTQILCYSFWFALNTATPPASLTSCTSPHNTIDQHVFFCRQAVLSRFKQRNNSIHTREMLGLLGWIGRPMRLQGVRSSFFFVIVFLLSDAASACFRLTQGFHCSDLLLGNRRRSSQFSGRLDWFEKLSRQHQRHQHTQREGLHW